MEKEEEDIKSEPEEDLNRPNTMGQSLSKMMVDYSPQIGISPQSTSLSDGYFSQPTGLSFPLAKRKERQSELSTGFYPGSDRYLFHLGGMKYVVVSKSAHGSSQQPDRIRISDLDPFKKKKVVRLNLQQWVDLVCIFSKINEVFEEEAECEGSAIDPVTNVKRFHIGGNVYVSLKKGLKGVDFRWFWLPPSETVDYQQQPEQFDVQPTRYGIWLNWHEWYTLTTLQETMVNWVPIEDMKECSTQHHNNRRRLLCSHCNPNGHHTHYM
jgi:hypothetical protein